jgi:hypothetical protein
MRPVLFVFLDGVGLGEEDPTINAFTVAKLPVLSALLEGRPITRASAPHNGRAASLVGLDASLGAEGFPQSGTGQAALLTGRNAVRIHGRHFGPWVPTSLRGIVREESVLARAKRAGRSVTFANAYPEEVRKHAESSNQSRLPAFLRAGPPLAALGAGVFERGTPELERGDAVASEITNDAWRERLGRTALPVIDAAGAGANLARIAARYDLTLFAHYGTDYAGHERSLESAIASVERVDAFLGGVLAAIGEQMLLVVASDHGNIEDARGGHTRNPAFCLVAGPEHSALARGLEDLTSVTPAILAALEVE